MNTFLSLCWCFCKWCDHPPGVRVVCRSVTCVSSPFPRLWTNGHRDQGSQLSFFIRATHAWNATCQENSQFAYKQISYFKKPHTTGITFTYYMWFVVLRLIKIRVYNAADWVKSHLMRIKSCWCPVILCAITLLCLFKERVKPNYISYLFYFVVKMEAELFLCS